MMACCLFLLLEVFFPGTPLSPSPQKPKLQISIDCFEGKVAATYSPFFFPVFSTPSERTENLISYIKTVTTATSKIILLRYKK